MDLNPSATGWPCPSPLSAARFANFHSPIRHFEAAAATLRELEAMTPRVQPKFSAELIAPVTPAAGAKRYRVALLSGCAQDLIFSDVNRDTPRCSRAMGAKCSRLPSNSAAALSTLTIGEWEPGAATRAQTDRPVSAGPVRRDHHERGRLRVHLKHYAKLLEGDPIYEKRAHAWDAKVKDIHEWLAEIGIAKPADSPPQTVTYHEACHLCHGQKITAQPRALLRTIPNLKLR
jgi:glycolate oxidase iron-sulfur subunit